MSTLSIGEVARQANVNASAIRYYEGVGLLPEPGRVPLPDGLGWENAEALLRPMVGSRRVVGLSVADFVPDKDPDGRYARHLVDLLAGLFAPRPAKI